MFVLTTLVYPCLLALLCLGAGLAVDRISGATGIGIGGRTGRETRERAGGEIDGGIGGRTGGGTRGRAGGAGWLPGMLIPVVGAATLICVSQLTTYIAPLAPATPYVFVLLGLAGFVLGRNRLRTLAHALTQHSISPSTSPLDSANLPANPACTYPDPPSSNPPLPSGSGSTSPLVLPGVLPREWRWQLAVGPLAYVIALAPVLAAGRPTSSYQALTDSAVHMLGADYLMRHGQDYAHLNLAGSYGQYVHNYYGMSYPSGADTLFGGTAFVLGLPLIWAMQPFAAFVLALATGPAWVLARRIGLAGGWAALASITATLPALVYGYELVASVKELVSLPMILALGALAVSSNRWLSRPAGVIPFALVLAAGLGALGVGFGVWGLTAAIVVGTVARGVRTEDTGEPHSRNPAQPQPAQPQPIQPQSVQPEPAQPEPGGHKPIQPQPAQPEPGGHRPIQPQPAQPELGGHKPIQPQPIQPKLGGRKLGGVIALGAAVTLVAAIGTWTDFAGSLHVAKAIASTANPGNLEAALKPVQALGTWLSGSYQHSPASGVLTALTYAIALLTSILAVLGFARIVYLGERALAGWLALVLLAGVALLAYATTWIDAKAIMLSSPVLVLLAWSGIAGLRSGASHRSRRSGASHRSRRAGASHRSREDRNRPGTVTPSARHRTGVPRTPRHAIPILAAIILTAGIATSDAMQYHSSNLAPTARYEELARIDRRYAGHGPVLVLGFDEYALYVLRDLYPSGLEFSYPPVGLNLHSGSGPNSAHSPTASGPNSGHSPMASGSSGTPRPPTASYSSGRHGSPADLDHVPPTLWPAYPLVVTPRDPTISEPPAAYRLVWLGDYYEVWRRRQDTPAAIAHLGLSSTRPVGCAAVRRLARIATAQRAELVAAHPPTVVMVDIQHATHSPAWHDTHPGLVMRGAGELETTFSVPPAGTAGATGRWNLQLKGEAMPEVTIDVDAMHVATIAGEVEGNPHNPGVTRPIALRLPPLSPGEHTLTIARPHPSLASTLTPGEGGWAILHQAFLTPANQPPTDTLQTIPPADWHRLCGQKLDWLEVTRE